MIIETYDKVYTVVRHSASNSKTEIYVCQNKEDQRLYTVIQIKDKEVTNRIIEFICEQKSNKKFPDLVDHFVYKEDLHVVFTYAEGILLEKRLKQKCTLEERMEIGKKLLEKLVLYQLPFYFQCHCLKIENIFQTDAMDIQFQYDLDDVQEHASYTAQTARAYLYQILKTLFDKELKNKVIDPMQEFLKKIQREEEIEYLKIYKTYCEVCDQIKKIPKEEMQTPKNRIFCLWQKIKSIRGIIKGSLMALIFICVFGYMVYTICMFFKIKGYEKHFKTIGTVQIENDGLEDKEE